MERNKEKESLLVRGLERFQKTYIGEKVIRGVYDFLIRNFPDYFHQKIQSSVEYGSLISSYSELREGLENTRSSLDKEEKARQEADKRIQDINRELNGAYKEQDNLRNILALSYEQKAEMQKKVKTCSPERLAELEKMLQEKQEVLDERNKLIQFQRQTISQERRAYKFLKAQERRNMLNSCTQDNVNRKEAVFVLNHLGRIIAQSESAKKIYGDLGRRHYFDLVSGSEPEKQAVRREFNKETEGWIELNVWKNGGKHNQSEAVPESAYIKVSPKYFLEKVENNRTQELRGVEVRYATVIEVSRHPFKETLKRIMSGEKVFQEKLRKRMQGIQEALETSRRLEEQEKQGGLEGLNPA
jgi:hypothetical protein